MVPNLLLAGLFFVTCCRTVVSHGESEDHTFCEKDRIEVDVGFSGTIHSPVTIDNTTRACSLVIINKNFPSMMIELKLSESEYNLVKGPPNGQPYFEITADEGDKNLEPKTTEYYSGEIFEIRIHPKKVMSEFTLTLGAFPVHIIKEGEKWSITDNPIAYLSSTAGFISKNPDLDKETLNTTLGNRTVEGNVSLIDFPLTSTKVIINLEVNFGESTDCSQDDREQTDLPEGASQLVLSLQSFHDVYRDLKYTCHEKLPDIEVDVIGSPNETLFIVYEVFNPRPGYGFTLRYQLQSCNYDDNIYNITVKEEDSHKFFVNCKHNTQQRNDVVSFCSDTTWRPPLLTCETRPHTHTDEGPDKVISTVIILSSVTGVLVAILVGFIIFIVVIKMRERTRRRRRAAEENRRRSLRVGRDNPIIRNGDVIELYTPLEVYHVNSADKSEEIQAG